MILRFKLNGKDKQWRVDPGDYLLEVLRENGIKSPKRGCDTGSCGSCTVLLDGRPILSCSLPAGKVEGREQLAIEAYANALDVIPRTLAENAGIDGIDVLMELNNAHEEKGLKKHGIEIISGDISDMTESKVIEPLRVKSQAIEAATEVANMILRIDDVIASKGGGDEGGGPPGGPGGMPGGGMGGGMPPGMGGM